VLLARLDARGEASFRAARLVLVSKRDDVFWRVDYLVREAQTILNAPSG